MRAAWAEGGCRVAADAAITGVALQDPKGVVLIHRGATLAPECVGRTVSAIGGPPDEVPDAIAALGLEQRGVLRVSREVIMACDLDELVVPELVDRPGIVVRRATVGDVP